MWTYCAQHVFRSYICIYIYIASHCHHAMIGLCENTGMIRGASLPPIGWKRTAYLTDLTAFFRRCTRFLHGDKLMAPPPPPKRSTQDFSGSSWFDDHPLPTTNNTSWHMVCHQPGLETLWVFTWLQLWPWLLWLLPGLWTPEWLNGCWMLKGAEPWEKFRVYTIDDSWCTYF